MVKAFLLMNVYSSLILRSLFFITILLGQPLESLACIEGHLFISPSTLVDVTADKEFLNKRVYIQPSSSKLCSGAHIFLFCQILKLLFSCNDFI